MSEFASLQGRRGVVTGASSGIGRAMALELARAGADVLVHCARRVDDAEHVAADIRRLGHAAYVVQADLADAERLADFVDTCWSQLGSVDFWVNNAGVDLLTGGAAALPYGEKLERLFAVDIRATVLLGRMVGTRMRAARHSAPRSAAVSPPLPSLLNIGWDQAERGMEGESGELFATAKNAVMGFTRSLALSLAPEVRVNCIAPGWIRTAWGETASEVWQERVRRETPLERWGTPQDIANLARFLLSDAASYLTGQIFYANGGAER